MENNNNNTNPEEVGKMIGAAVNEVIQSQQDTSNEAMDNENVDSENVRITKSGKPDGRQVSPIRGGRNQEREAN